MAVNLSFIGGAGWQFFNDNGVPLSGGKIYTYVAGTTTPQTTYTSRSASTANTNPIILDAAGRTPQQIWSTEGVLYKYVVTDSNDVQIRVWDNIGGSIVASNLGQQLAASSGSSLVGFIAAPLAAVAQTVQTKLRETISVQDFGAVGDGITDDGAALLAAFQYAALNSVPISFVAGKTYLCDLNTIVISLQENATLTVYGNNALLKQRTANTTPGGNPALITVTSAASISATTVVNIYDLNFDGSVQPVNWAGSVLGTGSNALKVLDVAVVTVDSCKANKFWFSSVFQFLRCRAVTVTNCYMKEVGGHTILDDSASANGDAIQFYDIPNGAAYHVANCTFIGYPTTPYQGGYPHNLSRAGIVFEFGNGINPSFKATVDNCYLDAFSNVIHVELTAYADISVSNVVAKNGWALIFGAGQFFKVRADNCSWEPLVSGTYNGINGFTMCDVGATNYTIDVYNSYYKPVSANRFDGTYYGCTFDNFSSAVIQAGGTTKAFYNCTFNGVSGGPISAYQFFGDTFQIFDGCTFNGATPGTDLKLSFESRSTTPLRIMNCTFNDCGLWVNGGAGTAYVLDGCQFKYTAAIASLIIVNYGGTVNGYVRNCQVYAADLSSNTRFNSNSVGTLHELINTYIKNASVGTVYAQPFTMLGSTIEFSATATPVANGFYERFSDYVIVSACTFIQPTATPITVAVPDRRNSSVLKNVAAGTITALSNI